MFSGWSSTPLSLYFGVGSLLVADISILLPGSARKSEAGGREERKQISSRHPGKILKEVSLQMMYLCTKLRHLPQYSELQAQF